ncbi:MAG TPA: xanthine dehydrogenase family protein subunit M [Woeseiaceae bacterium]
MYEFNYHRPDSVAGAREILCGDGRAMLLAGGMTLLPAMKLRLARPSALVDLGGIDELLGIRDEESAIEIGAMVRHADVARSKTVHSSIPALAALAGRIGDPQVRNRGTLGGSIANSDPSADYPAAVLALNAVIQTDRRQIAADDYFRGLFETALQPKEIVLSVRFPKPKRAAYSKFPNPASRYAVAGVMVADTVDGVRVAVTGAGPSAFRATSFEAALNETFSAAALHGLTIAADDLMSDLHASAAYRAHLVSVMAKRAVTNADG